MPYVGRQSRLPKSIYEIASVAVKLVFTLVGVAAALFVIGGVGTIASFITHAEKARVAFMWIFLGGLIPTMALLLIALAIGAYHMILVRLFKRTPQGWFVSEKTDEE